jgi:hypothetical protein
MQEIIFLGSDRSEWFRGSDATEILVCGQGILCFNWRGPRCWSEDPRRCVGTYQRLASRRTINLPHLSHSRVLMTKCPLNIRTKLFPSIKKLIFLEILKGLTHSTHFAFRCLPPVSLANSQQYFSRSPSK